MLHLGDVFADSVFWIALVVKSDQYHSRAQAWSQRITGRIATTRPVLLEVAGTLSRLSWRSAAVSLLDHVQQRSDIEIRGIDDELWTRGWALFRDRPDKGWSLTDCISFLVMGEKHLSVALTADEHFRQAGYRAVLLEEP
jgi:predicted nucleic acid-binding protein